MYEDKKKKGGGKKKGSAKESDAQEAKNLVNDMEGGIKNAGDNEKSAKELKAEGKKLKQQARDKKKADRKSARATKRSDRKKNKSQKLQDKIDLQTLKGEQKEKAGKTISAQAKKDRVEKLKTKKEKLDGAAKKDMMMDEKMSNSNGAGRMGFTQNFGAARQNSYAQGAAKVASIMSFGASKKKGAADETGSKHSHVASSTSSSAPSLMTTSPTSLNSIANKIGGGFSSNFSANLNQEVPKAPTLTGNSYPGHSSASEIQTQMENPTQLTDENPYVYSKGYMQGRSDDNKASQLHKLSGDESRLTQKKRAGYLAFHEKNKLGPIMTEGNNPHLKNRNDKITSALTSNTLVPPLSRNYR